VSRAGCPHPNEACYEVERSCCCYHGATRTPRTRSIQNQSTPTPLISDFQWTRRFSPLSNDVVKVLRHSPLELSSISSVIGRTKDGLEKGGEIARAVHSETTAPPEMSQEQT